MDMNAILAALGGQGGSPQQRQLLLNPAPALAGIAPGASVQPPTVQPSLPQPGVPAAPQNHQPNQQAMTMLDQMMRGQGGQQQQQPPGPGMGQSPLGGLGNMGGNNIGGYLGLDPNYTGTNTPFAQGIFGNAAGYGGMFGMTPPTIGGGNISFPSLSPSMTMPSLG